MKNKSIIAVFSIFFSFVIYAKEPTLNLSIYSLLANYVSYNNQEISTSGVLGINFDGEYCLYTDIDSMQNNVWMNSILLVTRNTKIKKLKLLLGKYVLIDGKYNKKSSKQLETGTISEINRVRSYPLLRPIEE